MKNKELEPVEAVMNSLFRAEIRDLAVDLTDTGIDAIIESEMLQHIPVVRVINSFLKVTIGIRERHFLSKALLFIKNVNQGNVDEKEIEKRKIAAKNKDKWFRREIELVTIHLDRLDETEKAMITAEMYIEYINKNITWFQFREYLAIIERVFYQDFEQLLKIYDAYLQEIKVKEQIKNGDGGATTKFITELNCERLIAVGLIRPLRQPVAGGIRSNYNLTEIGRVMAGALLRIKNDIDSTYSET
jgi:hypothetical protein